MKVFVNRGCVIFILVFGSACNAERVKDSLPLESEGICWSLDSGMYSFTESQKVVFCEFAKKVKKISRAGISLREIEEQFGTFIMFDSKGNERIAKDAFFCRKTSDAIFFIQPEEGLTRRDEKGNFLGFVTPINGRSNIFKFVSKKDEAEFESWLKGVLKSKRQGDGKAEGVSRIR